MNKQPDRTDATRRAIVKAFWGLYWERPIDKISVRELTECAHVHRSTFYRYFTSTYDVLEQSEWELLNEIVEQAQAAIVANSSADFTQLSEALVHSLSQYADKLCLLLGPSGDPMFREKFSMRFKPVLESALHLPQLALKGEYFSELSLSIILTNLTFWHSHQDSCTLEEISALSRTLVKDGVEKLIRVSYE